MTRLTESITTHKIHSVHMTLRLLSSICLQDLKSDMQLVNLYISECSPPFKLLHIHIHTHTHIYKDQETGDIQGLIWVLNTTFK
jgi:hypothetical protein